MEKYYFEPEQECEFTELEIGGLCCLNCKQFRGIDYDEEWIKCIPYSAIQENETLIDKVEQLENEIVSLKGGM